MFRLWRTAALVSTAAIAYSTTNSEHVEPKITWILSRTLPTASAEGDKKKSVDEFINKLFDDARNFRPPDLQLPKIDKLPKLDQLYPAFTIQMDHLRESYARFWDFLSMDEFRQLVKDTESEAKDVECHPEVGKDAFVRRESTLCQQEQEFIQARKRQQREAFAKFIGVPASQVELEDIPVVGIASSGGGFRAMIGSAGYMKAMQETGALDLVMYTAGVSGSCWTLAQYYSPLTNASLDRLVDHLKSHTHTHLANLNNFIAILKASPQNSKLLMQGIIERYYQQDGEINLVDVFGMLLGGTLLTKREKAKENDQGAIVEANGRHVKPVILEGMKLSRQRKYFEDGSLPMPIYRTQFADIKRVFGGFFDAPISNELNEGVAVLNSGCGPGSFNIEMSKEYPQSTFIGLDLTNETFPSKEDRLPNCDYMVHNILKTLPFSDDHFGFIHQQYLIAGIQGQQWPLVLKEFMRTLKPGGWIELTEPVLGEPVNLGPKLAMILQSEADFSIARLLESQLANAGFINIQVRQCLLPMMQPESEAEQRNSDIVNGIGKAVRGAITQKHPELDSDAAFEQFLKEVDKEVKELQPATPVYRVYG